MAAIFLLSTDSCDFDKKEKKLVALYLLTKTKVKKVRNHFGKLIFKGATKLLYFMRYSRMVIILFSTDLYKSAFSNYSFGKTRFLSFCIFDFKFLVFLFFVLKSMSSQDLTRNATRSNNCNDLLLLSFTLKISIFQETYI